MFILAPNLLYAQEKTDFSIDTAVNKYDQRRIYIYVRNNTAAPLELKTEEIYVDGVKLVEGTGEKAAQWYDLCPNPLPPSGWGVVKIYFSKKTGKDIKVKLAAENGSTQEKRLKVVFPRILFSSYSFNRSLNKLYLCLQTPDAGEDIRDLTVNGKSCLKGASVRRVVDINGGHHFLAEVNFTRPLREGAYLTVRVDGRSGSNIEPLKVIRPFFPIGTWGVEQEVNKGAIAEEHLQDCREHFINSIHISFNRIRTGGDLEILKKYDMKALFDPEWGAKLPAVLDRFKDEPAIAAWYCADEPEGYGNDGRPMRFLLSPERRIQYFRERGDAYPTFFTHYPDHKNFYDYAGIADIVFPDDYPVSKRPLSSVVDDMKEAQKANAPAPIWFALQAFSAPHYGGRYPQPDELEFMAYSVLGLGARGIGYFNYGAISEPCYGVGKPVGQMEKLFEKGADKLTRDIKGIKEDSALLWEKIRWLNMSMVAIKDLLLKATPLQLADADNDKVQVYSLAAADEAVILFLLNQDYRYDQQGFSPHPLRDVTVNVKLPVWFKTRDLLEIRDGRVERQPYSDDAKGTVRIRVPELRVGSIYVLSPNRQLFSTIKGNCLDSVIPIDRSGEQIKPDGNLSDWQGKEPLVMDPAYNHPLYFHLDSFKETPDLSVRTYFTWDERKLYIAARVRDDQHRQGFTASDIWSEDMFHIVFDPGNRGGSSLSAGCSEYGFTLTKEGPQAFCWNNPDAARKGLRRDIELAVARNADITIYEAAIPLAELGLKPYTIFGMNFMVVDADKEPYYEIADFLQFTPGLVGGKRPKYFRKFILIGEGRGGSYE